MVTAGENKCPKCGGRIDTYRQDNPMSFNGTIIFKHICSSCGYVLGSNELSDKSTSNTASNTTTSGTTNCPVCGEALYMNADTYKKKCSKCDYSEVTLPHNPLTHNLESDSTANSGTAGLMGWICPKCGRGLSPFTSYCPCSVNWEITYGTNLTNSNTVSQNKQNIQDSKFMRTINTLNKGELPPIDNSDEGLHTHKNGWT